ncbi:MAG: cation transporter [Bacteroidales bacterium]|nr:cation transporter [Bacteroidales bacterium]
MKLFNKFKKQPAAEGATVYGVEGMNCNHCKMSVEHAVQNVEGVETAEANVSARTLSVTGTASEDDIRKAVEAAGFKFKGKKE